MYKQMNIFDFIEMPEQRTLFEQIFAIVPDPILKCANCLCQYCTHNVEKLYHTVKLEEVEEPTCFNCDECRIYSGDCMQKEQLKENCHMFVISAYGAKINRERIRVLAKEL